MSNFLRSAFIALSISFLAVTYSSALPTYGTAAKKNLMKTAAGCLPATAAIELDINNVKARVMTGGDMWWDQGTNHAAYEVPKGTGKNSLFAGSCWVAGMQNGTLKVAAQLYRSAGNDYWPGPLNTNNGAYTIDASTCNQWDKFWKLNRSLVNDFKALGSYDDPSETYRAIYEWPARGNGKATETGQLVNDNRWKATGTTGDVLEMDDREYAPFVDLDDNGIYNPETGDYPNMEYPGRGDQMIWWVFNDRGNSKLQTKSESIGLEVQTTAFAFSSKDFLNDATFYDYRVINRAGLTLDSAFMATWTDADLGYYADDYIGCDTARGLGILYNATNVDGNGEPSSYGENPPMIGVDFFIGPQKYFINTTTGQEDTVYLKMKSFTYFNNPIPGTSVPSDIQDPSNGTEFYFYMTGSRKNGQLFSYDFTGAGSPCTGRGAGEPVKFVFAGNMNDGWSECVCGNAKGDRRFIHSAGPFQLRPGDVNDVIIGATWVAGAGGCPTGSFNKIKVADDLIQDLFDNDFRTIEGPQAPAVAYRELDRSVILYWQNPANSTNFLEKFGYDIDSAKYRVKKSKAANLGYSDSLYQFEGYRIFQLRDENVKSAQIFDEDGKVNTDYAIEVKQFDIKNGVTQIVNYVKNIDINVTCSGCPAAYNPVIKVDGDDSGIKHSYVITKDAFASGDDQRLVNYKSYYFLIIAYSYNNFLQFNPLAPDTTQESPYLESAHGPNNKALDSMIIQVIPNPANTDMGNSLNSSYGDGIEITKLEGYGNGGNDIQMTDESEAEALLSSTGYQSTQPIYKAGKTPIDVQVIDPVKVQGASWKLYIVPQDTSSDFAYSNAANGVIGTNALWKLVDLDQNKVIYSEKNLASINEQILNDYGISITAAEVVQPGIDQTSDSQNGYITSDVDYDDVNKPWLAGVNDEDGQSIQNWIRSGKYSDRGVELTCDYTDNEYDTLQFYESMFANTTATKGTWAPYGLAATDQTTICGFGVALGGTTGNLTKLYSVDLVFTSDKSKWTKCAVIELRDDNNGSDPSYSEGKVKKFSLRHHASWNMDLDANGNPVYATDPDDMGRSYFPGYAINQETGERLNIVFGEDSYLKGQNGRDMIWNPTSVMFDDLGNTIFGGKHYVYIPNTKYDGGDAFVSLLKGYNSDPDYDLDKITDAYNSIMWVGLPLSTTTVPLLSLSDGLIPTTTRLRFRVTRPYSYYAPPGVQLDNTDNVPGYPKYQFSTKGLAMSKLGDAQNPYTSDKQKLLDRIRVVPNPYYAYDGYESNRLDTKIKIINLPRKATVHIYSLDGSLIKTITKDDDYAYVDWDVRNAKGLTIASGMYIFDVIADGIGETTIKWFGAMRPVDVNSF